MKINGTSNNSFQNKVLLDTFVEQISALQEDVARLQDADVALDNKISQQLSEEEFSDFQADAHVSNLTAAEINSETGFIGHLNSTQVDAENLEVNTHAEIQDLTALNANIPSLTTDDVTVQGDITSAGNITAKDAVLDNVSADKVETPLVEADLVKADVQANNVETDTATIKDKLTVKDIEVSGTVTGTGLSEVNAGSVNANEAEIETINTEHIRSWISQVMNQEESLLPTPQLGDIDRYTIELPKFNGVYLLSWEDQDIVWSATVIGNGKSYGISWGSRTDENFITDLFQYNGKLYIRVRSNGRLKFAYSATKELPQPVIYFNMVGWTSDKSLEELCDERSHLINAYPTGMIWFGKVFIPRLEVEGIISNNNFNFKGSCTLAELPAFADTDIGDVWNITEETYTDSRFVEGAGKPINVGDDVVAVEDSNFEGGAEFEQINGPYSIDTISIGDYNKVEVHAINGNRILIQAGAYSTDGGQTWIRQNYNAPSENNILVLSNGKILWNSDHSEFLSEDNGVTFNYIFEVSTGPIIELPNGKVYGFYDNSMADFGTKDELVLGDYRDIIPSGTISKATVINSAVFIETMAEATYISTDNCETWTLYSGTVDFSKSFISYYDESEVVVKTEWVVSKVVQFNNSYYIERWMDWYGGRSYYKTTDFENFYLIHNDLPYISFTKNNITGMSYGIDSNGNLFTSTDDGNTWTETTPYNVAYGFIYCDSTGTLWAGSRRNGFRKSTDGGQTWQSIQLTAGTQPTITSVIEAPNGNLIAVTDGRSKWVSTDRGQTWEQHYADDYHILNPYIIDGKIWATSEWYDDEDKIGIITSEDGIEWTAIDSQDVNFYNNFLQLVIDENGYIYYANRFSKDRGVTWEDIDGPILTSLFNFERKILGVYSDFDNTPYSLLYQSVPGIVKTLKWDKFAAGVNYDNFAATNITASTALKSEGTLEVDGTSQFDDDVTVNADLNADKIITPDLEVTGAMTANSTGIALTKNVTHTGDYTQTGNQTITGNLNRTGNETVSGNSTLNNVTANTVIIGDLD